MASCWKKLSQIDIRTKYGIYGWMRQAEKELKLPHIPLMISSICILYFFEDEIFNEIGNQTEMSKDRKCIKNMSNKFSNTNYGIIEIDSNSQGFYRWEIRWEIRLKSQATMTNIIIGITDTTDPNKYHLI